MGANPGQVAGVLRSLVLTLRTSVDEVFPRVVDVVERELAEPWAADDAGAYCGRCGATAGPGAATREGCAFCHNIRLAWDGLTRLGAYEAPLDERVRVMKFHRQWPWGPWLGERLAAALPGDIVGNVVVVPVPMHWRRRWVRGYNQAALIAGAVARQRGWPVAEVLHRTKHTPAQTNVAPSQRQANVRGSVEAVRVDLSGFSVVLVDDVKTTGATLGACAKALRERGAARVHIAVAAVADPKGAGFRVI